MTEELKNEKITITKKAASRLKNIIENEEDGNKGIRVTIDEIAPSLLWSKATVERTYGSSASSSEPVARENYEEDEAPF